jgi:ABC-type multidrug transport system fused ATPase/permease subunit
LTLQVASALLPSDRPLEKGQFLGTLRRLMGFARPYRVALWSSILLALGAQLFELAVPWLTGDVIDQAIQPRDTERLKTLILLMLGAAVLRFVLMTIRRLVSGSMAVSIEYDLRNVVYSHLQRLSFSFFDHNQTGQLMSRATADVGTVRIFLSYGLLFFTQYIITIVGVLVVLLITDPVLSLVAIAVTPLIVWTAIRYSRRSHPILTQAQQTLADVTTQAEEAVVGVRVVKAFGQERRETAQFRDRSERIFEVNVRANALRALYVPLLAFIPALAVAAVLGVGGWMVIEGQVTLGDFVRFNLLLGMLVMPLRMLGMWVGQAQRAVASGVRVLELLDLEPEIVEPAQPQALPTGGGAIRFEGVRFGYDPDRPIVCDVDLDVPAGSTVALIGPTGCGKTTLTTLVPRFYDVTAGRVLVDGVDVRDLSLAELRRNIGVVTEDTFLFSASVRENIAFGAPWATDDDVHRAAERAQAAEFIESLPDGYHTQIGERGLTLSGGQRQRIAIARALLVDPRILILDDATAAVDATTEAKIKRALQEVMRDRTTIIIAHRLSTIALADEIVVLDHGRVAARGTQSELLEESPVFREIHEHGLLQQQVAG